MNNNGYLFRNYNLADIIEHQKREMLAKINNEENEYLANINIENYLEYLYATYKMDCPLIQEDKIYYEQHEGKIERYNQFYSEIGYIDGIVINVYVPFVGNKDLFLAKANTWSTGVPMASIIDSNILFVFGVTIDEIDTFDLQSRIEKSIQEIKRHLEFTKKDLTEYNESIKTIAIDEINYKIEKYKKISKFTKDVPYKLLKNDNQPLTYKVPNVVQKIEIVKPVANQTLPEPIIEENDYNHILNICSDMAVVMERSPKVFSNMDEETIRTHFLVQLNGHYQGQATGETFNSNGKTDILIRNDNQNVFIAECKFWKGKKGYLSTIDQLLGYVTYRDTKTAIFMFVKNKNFTEVFQQMKETVTEHSNFVKFIDSYTQPKGSSAFRCEFKNQNDAEKHFYITIMAFCIPLI